MKVSVIIPVFNVEAYITECLESVAQQTYQGEMECLIVDDCGTDDSIPIAENFIQSYQGNITFRILHHKHNRGLSAARNTGMEEASGEYVYFLDSDDAIIPETIEVMMKVVSEYPGVEMVQGGIVGINGQDISDFTKMEIPTYTNDAAWIAKNMFFSLPVSSWNRLLRREFLLKEKITFHEGIIHEDVPYCYILSLRCRHVGFVKKNTYLFRSLRVGSITNTPQEERALQSRLIIMNDCIDAYLTQQSRHQVIKRIALNALWKKWMNYMTIHRCETLLKYKEDLSDISKRMCEITSWPRKAIAVLYVILPLRIKHNNNVANIWDCILNK